MNAQTHAMQPGGFFTGTLIFFPFVMIIVVSSFYCYIAPLIPRWLVDCFDTVPVFLSVIGAPHVTQFNFLG
jgi:hypothetical protein